MERILSPRSSRTFYNVADAMLPPASGAGAGDVDLVPWVERVLRGRGPGAARRTWLVLAALEWWPILTLEASRGFSQAPLERRRRILASWGHSRVGPRRAAVRGLEALLHEALESYLSSEKQLHEIKDQSEGGA